MSRAVVTLAHKRNPLAALERLPGWWLGKAETRRKFADEARQIGRDREADEHDRIAREYEARIKAAGEIC